MKHLTPYFTWACVLLCLHAHAVRAQDAPAKLTVGVADQPPLVIAAEDNVYDGLAVQLWEAVAERADVLYDFRQVKRSEAAGLLKRGELDVFLTATPATGSTDTTSHSPIYFSSNLAVASQNSSKLMGVARGLLSMTFLKIILALSGLLLVIGVFMWLAERKKNEDQFGGTTAEGIGDGFWWAGVTLTTIGYGDKAPITLPGRVIAMLWMLIGLAVSASLTAAMVSLADSSGTSLQLPGDLKDARNVIVEGHGLIPFLERQGVDYVEVPNLQTGFRRVSNDSADHLVANEMELTYLANERSSSLNVQSSRIEPNYYAISFRQNLPQAAALSEAVRATTTSVAWPKWLEEYVPR